MSLAQIEQALRNVGFTPRGAFHPRVDDGVPMIAEGMATRTVVLAGNAGPQMWNHFQASGEAASTLDAWSRRVLEALVSRWQGRAVFPFERPYLPFQRWAMRAEPCHPSPLGILVHPDYGLWHSYRGALLIGEELDLPAPDNRPSPCTACEAKPCLGGCPVRAFTGTAYDVPACTGHLAGTAQPACMRIGCLARHACPVGRDYRYQPAQASFHMRAFLASHRTR